MPVVLHSAWHAMSAHFAVGFTLGSSALVVVGLIARALGYREFALKLTPALHTMLLLAIISMVAACGAALADFPPATFAASPWFQFKANVAIVAFFIYAGMYLLTALRGERVWESPPLAAYMLVFAVIGGWLVTLLGAAGGVLSHGHSVLEPMLAALGLPVHS